MDHMPVPGDMVPNSFTAWEDRCFRMIYDHNLQATHCAEPVVWKGRWRDRTGKAWEVEACEEHGPKATGGDA